MGRIIKTDVERGRTIPGWKPKRLGGGPEVTEKQAAEELDFPFNLDPSCGLVKAEGEQRESVDGGGQRGRKRRARYHRGRRGGGGRARTTDPGRYNPGSWLSPWDGAWYWRYQEYQSSYIGYGDNGGSDGRYLSPAQYFDPTQQLDPSHYLDPTQYLDPTGGPDTAQYFDPNQRFDSSLYYANGIDQYHPSRPSYDPGPGYVLEQFYFRGHYYYRYVPRDGEPGSSGGNLSGGG